MLGVHRGGERLRAAWGSFEHEHILRGADIEQKFFEGARESGDWRRFVGFGGGERLVSVNCFDEAQLAEIARERSLGDAHAEVDELAAQIVLTGDCFAGEEFQDLTLAEFFMSAHD